MTGRKKPDVTEAEKEHEYVLAQKLGQGEAVTGEGGEFLDEMGAVGEVERRREAWAKEHGKRRPGEDASRPDDE